MQRSNVPARIHRAQQLALVLLVLAGTVNYLDRSALSVANPLVRQELHLSVADMGLLLSAFLWVYALAQLPSGILVDRVGPRRLLTAGLVLWSIAQAAAGLTASFAQLWITRILLGLGEAPMFASAVRVVRDWYNVRDRGLPTGIWSSTSSLGSAVAPPLLTALMLTVGWRMTFLIIGIAGLAVAAFWFAGYRDAEETTFLPEERLYLILGEEAPAEHHATLREWRQLFRFRTTWGLILGYFGVVYIGWLYLAWLPAYLEIQRHMTVPKTGWVAAIPFVFGVFGAVGGGWIADRLARAGVSPINSRKVPIVVALLGMAGFTATAALSVSNTTTVICISLALMFGNGASGLSWALSSIAAPANLTAALGSIQNFGGYLGGALAPAVTGLIVQQTGSFIPALLASAAIGVVSAIAYLLVIRSHPISSAEVAASSANRSLPTDSPA